MMVILIFKNLAELEQEPNTDNIISKKAEANERNDRIVDLIKRQRPDILFLQEYIYKSEAERKKLPKKTLAEIPDNWGSMIYARNLKLTINMRRLVGFKCHDLNNSGTIQNPLYKKTKQEDATAVYYNPAKFTLIDAESGCFMDSFEQSKKPVKGQYGSGSAYNVVLLKDMISNKRILGINIHVKVTNWDEDDRAKTHEEMNKYLGTFIQKHNISSEDYIIFAGDLNASKYAFSEQRNDATTKDYEKWNKKTVKEKNRFNFIGFVEKINDEGLVGLSGPLREIRTPMPTSVNCETGEAEDIDHIFISENFVVKKIYNGAYLFNVLRLPCRARANVVELHEKSGY